MTVASVVDLFPSFQPGQRLVDGGELLQLVNLLFSAKVGIVAHAGGGQAGAVADAAAALSAGWNRVDTVATASDSVALPQAVQGRVVAVNNNTATLLAVFGQASNPLNAAAAGDTIASSASNVQQPTATGITLATTLTAIFVCFTNGQWKEFLTA